MREIFKGRSKLAKAASAVFRPGKQEKVQHRGFSALETLDDDTNEVTKALDGLEIVGRKDSLEPTSITQGPSETKSRGTTLSWASREEPGWTEVPRRTPVAQISENSIGHSAKTAKPWEDDWRKPSARTIQMNKRRMAGASTLRTTGTRRSFMPGPRNVNGEIHSNFKVGTITWRWDIRPYKGTNISDSDKCIVKEKDVSRSLKKGRYWVIVKVTEKTVWEIPIYTNGDTGLANTPLNKRRE
jgi:hypothetical protein